MEDDHVDRPGVEVRQRMELTGTNSSIGLIALIYQCPSLPDGSSGATLKSQTYFFASFVLGRTGGFSGGPVPDPISNSAVKLPSADGTKS